MSRLDISRYRSANIKALKSWFDRKGTGGDLEYKIAEYSATYGLHLVATAHFVGEVYGFTPELREMITRLRKNTQVTEVEGEIANHDS